MNSDRSCGTQHITGSILVLKANFEPFAPLKTKTTWFGTQKLQLCALYKQLPEKLVETLAGLLNSTEHQKPLCKCQKLLVDFPLEANP